MKPTTIAGWLGKWPMHKLWPHREGWSGDCPKNSEHEPICNAWQGGQGTRWTQKREMRVDDFFRLYLGKSRVISRIKLLCEERERAPERYKLLTKSNPDAEWEYVGEFHDLDVRLPKPKTVVGVQWVITQPHDYIWPDTRLPSAWSIYDIRLTEVRLFGRWWEKVIEEKR